MWIWIALIAIVVVAAVLLWLLLRGRTRGPKAQATGPAADIAFLTAEANKRLAASSRPPLARFPLVLIAGEPGSTKTTIAVNSGLHPELLSGQDRQVDAGPVPPTGCANFWLAGETVLVEAGGPLLGHPGGVAALAAKIRAASAANFLGASAQAPRALILCVDIEQFLQPDAAASTLAAAKKLRAVVGETAAAWDSRMPMYVLFTRMDKVKYFSDFVLNLSTEEAGRVFGITLPLEASLQPGIYDQEQASRLNAGFEQLQGSLVDSRMDLLYRENDLARTPNTYEFPREFRKLRDTLARFLVELGRPSQLQATPFLRGFFFTGVRPVVVEGGRRVPQWVFLQEFFSQALLGDRLAFQAASTNTSASRARNWLLGAAAALSLLWFGGATASYFQNKALLEQAALPATLRPALLDKLREAERLRVPAKAVTEHRADRPPMSYRWGVYPGEPMQQAVRENYCAVLEKALLKESRALLGSRLRSRRAEFDPVYNDLKAYLMLTRHPEHRDPGFLAYHLTNLWTGVPGEDATNATASLMRKQLLFVGAQRERGFCTADPDSPLVENTRSYLSTFKFAEQVYSSLLATVNRKGQPIAFDDASGAVRDPRTVPYAFSKSGFAEMKAELNGSNLSREAWVVGTSAKGNTSPDKLREDVTALYRAQFSEQWNGFVEGASVTSYATMKDAAVKLESLASGQSSPLVRLFCIVAVNTEVEDVTFSEEFKPYRTFAPPATCAKDANSPANQSYLADLGAFKENVKTVAGSLVPGAERLSTGEKARTTATNTASNVGFKPKPAKLLRDPIEFAENLDKVVPAVLANGKGNAFCQDVKQVLTKYPFTKGGQEAQLGEVAALFAPGKGTFYAAAMDQFSAYVSPGVTGNFNAKAEAPVSVSPGFTAFLNKGVAFSKLFFQDGTPQPKAQFTLVVLASPDIEEVELKLGGKTWRTGARGGERDFTWPDDVRSAQLSATSKSGERANTPPFRGDWALTQLFDWPDNSSVNPVVFPLGAYLGKPGSASAGVKIEMRMKSGPLSLMPKVLRTACVARVAQ